MKKNYYNVTIKANLCNTPLDLYSNDLTKKEFMYKLKSYGYDEEKTIAFGGSISHRYIKHLDTLTIIFTIDKPI